MKLRIKGNSVRLRLTKTDVRILCTEGRVSDETQFAEAKFKYQLIRQEQDQLSASFENQILSVFIPGTFTKNWDTNDHIGFEYNMPLSNGTALYILVEKDFVCLDESTEDQSDNYDNPNLSC